MDNLTLREAANVLGINPKTLGSWLERAGIEPQIDDRDRRRRLVTREQISDLAAEFGRPETRAAFSTGHIGADSGVGGMTPQEVLAWEADLLQRAQGMAGRAIDLKMSDLRNDLVGRIDERNLRMDYLESLFETLTRCVAMSFDVSPLGPIGAVVANLAKKFGVPVIEAETAAIEP